MNLYIVNVIIPNAMTLTTRVVADDARTARRLAVTNCPQAKGTLAYGEVVKCFPPVVGVSLPVAGTTPRRKASSSPGRNNAKIRRSAQRSLTVGNRRPRQTAAPVAPVTAKRIPARPGRAFSPDTMSFGEASLALVGYSEVDGWLDGLKRKARKVSAQVAAEVAAEIEREEFGSVDGSNFLVGVPSAYAVEAEGWDGWKVTSR